jgi:hypothetical protein
MTEQEQEQFENDYYQYLCDNSLMEEEEYIEMIIYTKNK